MRIGEQIKNYRKTEGLTQEQVANYLGVSTPAVNKWEKGESYYESVICKKPCCREKIYNQRNGTGWYVCSSSCSNITDFTANAYRCTDHHSGIWCSTCRRSTWFQAWNYSNTGLRSVRSHRPIMTWLCGIRPKTENKTKNLAISIVFALIGLLIVETIGGLQWHFVGGSMSIPAIAVYSLTAFIPKDIVITVLAVLIAIPIRKGINNAGNR